MTEAGIESLVRQLADGRFHSGESLARLLGVSRTAVWKRIRKISRDTGLDIHAVRGKGYRLALPLELLDADRIAGHISSGSSVEVEVEVHPSLPSTSSHLAERLGELPDNTLCFAEHQTAGRGRRGRQWVSPYGSNLYFSIYRRFPLGMHELAGLRLAVGACSDVAQRLPELEARLEGLTPEAAAADLTADVLRVVPAGRRIAFLEGGYDLTALQLCTHAVTAALAGEVVHPERPSSGGPGAEAVVAAAQMHAPG